MNNDQTTVQTSDTPTQTLDQILQITDSDLSKSIRFEKLLNQLQINLNAKLYIDTPIFSTAKPLLKFANGETMESMAMEYAPKQPLPMDSIVGLYQLSFSNPADKQWHNCRCCHDFIVKYAGLVTVNAETGETTSLLWDPTDVDAFYVPTIIAMKKAVESCAIESVFCGHPVREIGIAEKNGHHHFAFNIGNFGALAANSWLENNQSKEAFRLLKSHVSNTDVKKADLAAGYFKNDAILSGLHQFASVAIWVCSFMKHLSDIKNQRHRDNIIWLAVAARSAGYINFGSTSVGDFINYLEPTVDGHYFAQARGSFLFKVDPTKYMRATAAPAEGNVAATEKLLDMKGLKPSMERRHARIDEIPFWLWKAKPKEEPAKKEGMFANLTTKQDLLAKETAMPVFDGGTKTWVWFEREVLPQVESMRLSLIRRLYDFGGFVTAVHADAPPIMRWDKLEQRNPISTYVAFQMQHHSGTEPKMWGMEPNQKVEISAITVLPEYFYDEEKRNKSPRIFVIPEATFLKQDIGLCLFASNLIPSLYSTRSVIEAYSNANKMPGREHAFVTLALSGELGFEILAKTPTGTTRYYIDRHE